MKIKYEPALQACRDRTCEWCNRKWGSTSVVPHHLFGRGHGGGCRLDAPFNLIALCEYCHYHHHSGNEPTRADLLAVAAARDNVLQPQIKAKWDLILRTPKEVFRGYRGQELQKIVALPLQELQEWIRLREPVPAGVYWGRRC